MAKPVQVSEDTELQISLKTAGAILFAVVSAAGLVFHVESNMDDVQGKLEKQEINIQTLAQRINSPQVQEAHTELAVLKIRLEMLEQQLADLKSQRQN
jgi:hypothetical protein